MHHKNNVRTREAKKRRPAQANWNLSIPSCPPPSRTLRRAARKELERERDPQLWISPWVADPTFKSAGREYPQANLLGLPAELRQQILYESYSLSSLEEELEAELKRERESVETHVSTGKGSVTMFRGMTRAALHSHRLSRREGDLVTLLGRRIGTLCCVAPLLRLDMQYVSKQWQQDLEKHLNSKLPVAANQYEWPHNDDFENQMRKGRQGGTMEGKRLRAPGKRPRPIQCWYCMERHPFRDPVCPPARRDPAKWQSLTKKVGRQRSLAQPDPPLKGTRIVFDDDEVC